MSRTSRSVTRLLVASALLAVLVKTAFSECEPIPGVFLVKVSVPRAAWDVREDRIGVGELDAEFARLGATRVFPLLAREARRVPTVSHLVRLEAPLETDPTEIVDEIMGT